MTAAMRESLPNGVQPNQWLKTPLGRILLKQEERLVEQAFDGLFGEQCLQLGSWGESDTFLR
ncbi:MAG: hypothetical protein VYC03_02580, partial [Pseudomonadota bacterium]|nr:hypothetical protein [Pseudomonadota bacterium]